MRTPFPVLRRPLRWGSPGDVLYDVVACAVLTCAVLAILYPLYLISIASVSDPVAVNAGQVWFWPKGVSFAGYERVLSDEAVWRGFVNSVVYTVGATAFSVTLILAAGYALSRKDLPGRTVLTGLFLIPFFLDSGIIPRYLVIQHLGLLNTPLAMILPGAVAVWNLLIARAWFAANIPLELREAAQLDGAGEFRIFVRMVLPLAKPLIAVLVLIHAVWNWNAYFDALLYLTDEDRFPLQLVLRQVLAQSEPSTGSTVGDLASFAEQQRIAGLVKYALIVVSTIPLLILSPFAQRFLTRGALTGALKG